MFRDTEAGAQIARESLAPGAGGRHQDASQHPLDSLSSFDRTLIGRDGVRFTIYLLDRSQTRRDLALLKRMIGEAEAWLNEPSIPDRSALMATGEILGRTRRQLDRRRTSKVKQTYG